MRRLLITAALVALTAVVADATQNDTVRDDWLRVDACHISLLIPENLKRTNVEGVDSCVAEFANKTMTLSIDYGWYGGPDKKSDSELEFKERSIPVGRKIGRLATYIDDSLYARNNPGRKYVAHVYVVVRQPQGNSIPMTTSLTITVRGESEREQDIAQRIFRSIRFQ